MIRLTMLWPVIVAAAVALLAAPAPAVIETHAVQITYTGTLWGGSHDNAGLFGNAYSIDGLAFILVYKVRYSSFDPGTPGMPNDFVHQCDGLGCSEQARGGSAVAGFASIMTADLTIEGVTLHYSGDRLSRDTALTSYGGPSQIQQAIIERLDHNAPDSPDGRSQISGYVASNSAPVHVFPLDLATPYDVALGHTADTPNGTGIFSWWPDPNGASAEASGNLSFDHVALTALSSGVPEPASWATMMLGFGTVGGMIRRRPRAVAV